ncbi:GNAT family N-acetyltransferase [Bacteroides fragilis]|uniref:GNAT family N-acetyltransferase n=1 Tax=Bacteroides fragilis TaxID=817 RepID=UPI0021FB82BF|nr:GNAT family protein [Bacteroides fragilis]MCS2376021.1 GNAT family N-acetyltransferase [Bacteroides fragilis]MCZ2547003.1 GNAT family protein [Bacteroides fragilis]UVR28196.1 GNAT family N-acetyltransferase [Bacteroides fragilis]
MKIVLRPITLQDGVHLVKWRNDERVINHCLSRATITEESNKEFYENFVKTGKYKQFMVERLNEDFPIVAYPIATVYLKDVDYANKRCELCIFTSTDTEWTPDSQSMAIRMLVDKAFTEYGMHKVYSYVFYKYPDEVELLKNAGFSAEAILKDEALNAEGKYEDIVRLSIINTEK